MTDQLARPKGQVRSIGTCILLTIVTIGIYALVWVYKTHTEIKEYSGVGVGGGLGLLIYVLVSPVTWFILPGEVNQMLVRAGRPSRVSAVTGCWIFLPIIGAFVWFSKVQGQLNEFWTTAP